MASNSNELFQDALIRRQIALTKFERGLQQDIIELLDNTERDVRSLLADRLAQLEGKEFSPQLHSRLNVLEKAIEKIRTDGFDEAKDMFDSSMRDLAMAEAEYLDRNLKDVVPVKLDTVLPTAEQLAAVVSVQPLQGRVLSDWGDSIAEQDLQRIMDAIRIGMAEGEDTSNILRRIFGSAAVDGTDGVLEITRSNMASLVQTAVSTFANEARSEYYQANDDIFTKEQWVATLDDATCEECGSLDGEIFDVGDGDQPPAHFNCRCVRVAVIDGDALGDRPANAANADEMVDLTADERAAYVAEKVGTVAATTRYADWLEGQTEAFQDHVLGPSRAALFREGGLTLDKFVNSRGDVYSLDQLRQLEPAAFRKAGL